MTRLELRKKLQDEGLLKVYIDGTLYQYVDETVAKRTIGFLDEYGDQYKRCACR